MINIFIIVFYFFVSSGIRGMELPISNNTNGNIRIFDMEVGQKPIINHSRRSIVVGMTPNPAFLKTYFDGLTAHLSELEQMKTLKGINRKKKSIINQLINDKALKKIKDLCFSCKSSLFLRAAVDQQRLTSNFNQLACTITSIQADNQLELYSLFLPSYVTGLAESIKCGHISYTDLHEFFLESARFYQEHYSKSMPADLPITIIIPPISEFSSFIEQLQQNPHIHQNSLTSQAIAHTISLFDFSHPIFLNTNDAENEQLTSHTLLQSMCPEGRKLLLYDSRGKATTVFNYYRVFDPACGGGDTCKNSPYITPELLQTLIDMGFEGTINDKK